MTSANNNSKPLISLLKFSQQHTHIASLHWNVVGTKRTCEAMQINLSKQHLRYRNEIFENFRTHSKRVFRFIAETLKLKFPTNDV